MTIQYAIQGLENNTTDLTAWVEKNLPNLLAVNFFQFGTDRTVSFKDGDGLGHAEAVKQGIVEIELDRLNDIEKIIRSIREFNFDTSGHLVKYNPHKKVFIVDLTYRVGAELEVGETIESLSSVSCTLNDDFSFTIDPTSLNTTHASCYGGEDDWGNIRWDNVATHIAFADLTDQFRSKNDLANIQAEQFIVSLIDKLYKDSIQANLEKVTRHAESLALVQ